MVVTKLSPLDKDNIISHLQALEGEERRLRFGGNVSDDYIEHYVNKTCGGDNDRWFGVYDDPRLVSACHVALDDGAAELGCSVDKEYRNHKLAQAMFDRAITWLRTRGIRDVCMHCLSENSIMKHIARKNNMAVISEDGESDANVKLEPANPLTVMVDLYADRMAMYDMIFKANLKMIRFYDNRKCD